MGREGKREGGKEEENGGENRGWRGMEGGIAEAKLQEKGEGREQQIQAGEGNGVPGEGSCCSWGWFGSVWDPPSASPQPVPPQSSDPTSPTSPSPDVLAPVPPNPGLSWGQEGLRMGRRDREGKRKEREGKRGGPNVKRFKINQSRVWQ